MRLKLEIEVKVMIEVLTMIMNELLIIFECQYVCAFL
jgi:hypothetical protein